MNIHGIASDPPPPHPSVHDVPGTITNNYQSAPTTQERTGTPGLPAFESTGGGRFVEQWDASRRGSSILDGHANGGAPMTPSRPQSFLEGDDAASLPRRSNTLKKKASLRRSGSLKRSGSRRSMRAGSVRSLALRSSSDPDDAHSVFYCPVPTSGNPTDVLASRFQAWRKMLKDLIAYFRELSAFYEQRSKSLVKLVNVANNMSPPAGLLSSGGLEEALDVVKNYNEIALAESQRAREMGQDVILSLTGLRGDLQLKIKEIKNLAGDFKNSVEKEMDATRRVVKVLQEGLGQNDVDTALTVGKQDPYLLRLAVDRQVWKQLEEENYLHQAYLNLEHSGRELESIVVGEIQKAYAAHAKMLKSGADVAYAAMEELRTGPIVMPKDQAWNVFVKQDEQFVDPKMAIRSAEHVHYPGRDHPSCQEIRAGLLERKSKYLRSYTAGWYVLSPTHLHEFKSADKGQGPVMSLYLPEQKPGSRSAEGASSNKFVLKGRQTGAMHRGHTWVFRAESFDTMMAWYEDIKMLTKQNAEDRSSFVRGHARSLSRSSRRSTSSDGVVDEDDDEPFSANTTIDVTQGAKQDSARRVQQPGGRFPSDIQVDAQRGLQAPHSPSSLSSEGGPAIQDLDSAAGSGGVGPSSHAAPGLSGEIIGAETRWRRDSRFGYGGSDRTPMEEAPSHAAIVTHEAREDGVNPYWSDTYGHDYGHHAGSLHPIPSQAEPLEPKSMQHQSDAADSVDDDSTLITNNPYVSEAYQQAHGGADVGITRPGPGGRIDTGGLSLIHVPGEYPKQTPVRGG